jgi:predicted CDP-diglyceride synthetase/phosphatidate cytidylyltransferase
MKKILAILLLAALVGCTSSTEYGQCVGAFDEKDPKLTYKVSAWNVAMGVLFFSLVAPPIFVIVDETFCPVGRK